MFPSSETRVLDKDDLDKNLFVSFVVQLFASCEFGANVLLKYTMKIEDL